jgi:purine-binding chemotaxis protein CheW
MEIPGGASHRTSEEALMTGALLSEQAENASVASLLKREAKQFISFKTGNEEYAIDIMAVREIRGWSQTTALPHQSPDIFGVMNLRGTIVPVFDMRRCFGMGATDVSISHVVIVVAVADRLAGLLVDAVSDILTIDTGEVRPVPETNAGASAAYLAGIVTIKDAMVVILSLDKLFSGIGTGAALN